MPLNPMSAIWIRAHEFGQPLTWMRDWRVEVGESLLEVVADHLAREPFVSTMASLQYSMPVHAIAPRRNGRTAPNPECGHPDWRSAISSMQQPDIEDEQLLLRREAHPATARPRRRSATARAPSRRAARLRRGADVAEAVSLGLDATWSRRAGGGSGAGPSVNARRRYSVSSTSRNFATPQSATRNLIRARWRSRRYP